MFKAEVKPEFKTRFCWSKGKKNVLATSTGVRREGRDLLYKRDQRHHSKPDVTVNESRAGKADFGGGGGGVAWPAMP